MILIDTNLLVAAGVETAQSHDRARVWLDEQLSSGSRIGLPWHSVLGFVRLASDRRTFPAATSVQDVWQTAREWLNAPNAWIPQPTERHADVIENLILLESVGTRDVLDLHLAALAIEHGLMLCSADTGFVRFRQLRWMNPLA